MDHSNIIYEFELISTSEPTIHVVEGPKAMYMKDESLKQDILEKLNIKWQDIGDLDPDLQKSIKSIRPKFQKVITILLSIDIALSLLLVILSQTFLKANKYNKIVTYSFYALIIFGLLQTLIILYYIYSVMKTYTQNMEKWRKLFKNQMTFYVENTLSNTVTNIDDNYEIAIHEQGHKLYVVLSYLSDYSHGGDKSSILNFSEVTNEGPSLPINTRHANKQPLLLSHQNNESYSAV
mmetsp:Transcript_54679/g.87398  ORF Transcript_54679/g.87398 Transcript_54679/m.87398 type:complete len:236 (+) Transcript_54679:73-780(+)